MPLDSKGKFHLNSQRAMAADKMNSSATSAKPAKSLEQDAANPAPVESDEPHHKIYDQGNGAYRVEGPNGEMAECNSPEELKAHIDSLFGHGTDQETKNYQNDNPDHKEDEDPTSYRMLSGL